MKNVNLILLAEQELIGRLQVLEQENAWLKRQIFESKFEKSLPLPDGMEFLPELEAVVEEEPLPIIQQMPEHQRLICSVLMTAKYSMTCQVYQKTRRLDYGVTDEFNRASRFGSLQGTRIKINQFQAQNPVCIFLPMKKNNDNPKPQTMTNSQ